MHRFVVRCQVLSFFNYLFVAKVFLLDISFSMFKKFFSKDILKSVRDVQHPWSSRLDVSKSVVFYSNSIVLFFVKFIKLERMFKFSLACQSFSSIGPKLFNSIKCRWTVQIVAIFSLSLLYDLCKTFLLINPLVCL